MYTHIYLYIYIRHTIKIEEESSGKRYIQHQIARWLNGLRHQGNGELRAEQCQWTSRWPKAGALKLCELKLHSPVTQCQMTTTCTSVFSSKKGRYCTKHPPKFISTLSLWTCKKPFKHIRRHTMRFQVKLKKQMLCQV